MPLPGQNQPPAPASGFPPAGATFSTSPVPAGFQIPSMVDPDTMEVYGMPDKFRATILLTRALPYDFFRLRRQKKAELDVAQGKTPKPIGGRDGYGLSVAVFLVPDPGQGYETNMATFKLPINGGANVVEFAALEPSYYNAVSLFQFVPSLDGVNPAGNPPGSVTFDAYRDLAEGKYHITKDELGTPYDHEDLLPFSGPFMAPTSGYNADGTIKGSHRGIDQGSDWAHFIDACVKAGLRINPADWQSKGLAAFEGHRGRFDRLKVKNKGKSEGEHEILLMTEYLGSSNGASAGNVGTGSSFVPAPQTVAQAAQVATPATASIVAPGVSAPAMPSAPVSAPAVAVPPVDPLIVEFIRATLTESGGKAAIPTIIPKVASYPGFIGNAALIGQTYPFLFNGTPPEIAARMASIGFGFNPQTQEIGLPGVQV